MSEITTAERLELFEALMRESALTATRTLPLDVLVNMRIDITAYDETLPSTQWAIGMLDLVIAEKQRLRGLN